MHRHLAQIATCLLLLFCNQSCKTGANASATKPKHPRPTGVLSFLTTRDGNFEVYTMKADGSNVANLTNDALEDYSPDWSPNGKWIAYSSGTSKQYDVWVINVKTKNKIRLTTEPKRNETPVWRPK